VTAALANDTKQRAVFALDFDVIDATNGSVRGRAQKQYTLAPGKRTQLPDRSVLPRCRQGAHLRHGRPAGPDRIAGFDPGTQGFPRYH
jgi:hypothetical protein